MPVLERDVIILEGGRFVAAATGARRCGGVGISTAAALTRSERRRSPTEAPAAARAATVRGRSAGARCQATVAAATVEAASKAQASW